jgi:hypothetical protein
MLAGLIMWRRAFKCIDNSNILYPTPAELLEASECWRSNTQQLFTGVGMLHSSASVTVAWNLHAMACIANEVMNSAHQAHAAASR